jgi:hypothetical protein
MPPSARVRLPPALFDRLKAVLATLLPAEAPFPSGATVSDVVAADLSDAAAIIDALPAGFAAGDEAPLRALEAAQPEAFDRLLRAAYLAYYTDHAVRLALEATAGYPARPPQPRGYHLPPFDDSLLDRQRRAAPAPTATPRPVAAPERSPLPS